MNPLSALIASTGLTASRAFLPAFIAALLLRFGADHAFVHDAASNLLGANAAAGGHVASWFTSNPCLITLGILAALEFAAQRNHDARAIMVEIDHYAKPLMAIVTMLGLLSTSDANFATNLAQPQQASLLTPILAMFAAFGTFLISSARNDIQRLLHDADSENATGIHGLLAWGEDIWAALGMFAFIFFPIAMAILIAAVIAVILLLQRLAKHREEASKIPCTSCAHPIYPTALRCPNCHAANPHPRAINFLGTASKSPANLSNGTGRHAFNLLTKRRCPSCATRLEAHTPRQSCPACHTITFADRASIEDYDHRLSQRFIPTLILTAAMGLIPILGLIAGVIFYRYHLIAPYRAYLPHTKNILFRWSLRVLMFFLILFHLVPVVGALTAPVLALINYTVYRRAFLLEATGANTIEVLPTSALPAL